MTRIVLCAIIVLVLIGLADAPSMAAVAPDKLFSISTGYPIRDLQCDAQGRVYLADEHNAYRFNQNGGRLKTWWGGSGFCGATSLAVAPNGWVYAAHAAGGGPCTMDRIIILTEGASQSFGGSGSGPGEFGQIRGMTVDPFGNLFVSDYEHHRIQKFSPKGGFISMFGSEGSGPGEFVGVNRLRTDSLGNLFVTDSKDYRIQKFDNNGNFIAEWRYPETGKGQFISSPGLGIDSDDNVYLMDRYGQKVIKYTNSGQFIEEWSYFPNFFHDAIDVDPNGNVWVASHQGATKFDNHPGPSPIYASPPHSAAIMLHAAPAQRGACRKAPSAILDIITQVPSNPEGAFYHVYVLGTPNTLEAPFSGLTGVQFGIEYASEEVGGLKVLEWHHCTMMDFSTPTWPASGTGNTATWSTTPFACQQKEIAPIGYFYVGAYAPSTLSLTPYPEKPSAKMTTCSGAEQIAAIDLGWVGLGWVSLGGFRAGSAAGCNPGLEPCDPPVSVEPATWGSLKSRFAESPEKN